MRIAVMGAGGIGGYYGARLARAGVEVALVARGAHLAAIQAHGLRVTGPDEDFTVRLPASDDAAALGPADAVIFGVKLYDTETAARAMLPLLGPDTMVVTVQNGVESVERIAAVVGPGRTVGAAAYFPSNIAAPGVIEHADPTTRVDIAEPDAPGSGRVDRFAALCREAGLDTRPVADLRLMLWTKFVHLGATSGLLAMTRRRIGAVQADPVLAQAYEAALAETWAVGRALGVPLADDLVAKLMARMRATDPGVPASQLIDIERGKPLELEWIAGTVHRLGRELGVPTPVQSTIYAALRPFAAGSAPAQP